KLLVSPPRAGLSSGVALLRRSRRRKHRAAEYDGHDHDRAGHRAHGESSRPYWVLGAGDCSGFGGRARSRLMLAPPKKDAPFRSTTWCPSSRYCRSALSHWRPIVATSFIQSPYAVSSGASVMPYQTVMFGCRVVKSSSLFARVPVSALSPLMSV